MATTQQEFDAAYWASQPPEVQALPGVTDQGQREQRAATLAGKGYTIDVPIMVWGWDAWIVMNLRQQFGYTWVPSALQAPLPIAPGISQPGTTPYDPLHPPSGSIRVSTNIADYPPYVVATAPPPPEVAEPVGAQALGKFYLSAGGETYPDGYKFTDARGTFLKHRVQTPFGFSSYWELVS